jgi:hypothetical protein
MNATLKVLAPLAVALAFSGCSQSQPTAPDLSNAMSQSSFQAAARTTGTSGTGVAANAGSVKGAGTRIPAFYDGELFTINSLELADVAGDHIASNPSHNVIFVTNDLDDPQDFNPVLNAIQGDGFNPLWEQIQIVFNPGVTPRQFFSDDEVENAAAGSHPDITLVDTGELYRCSVVGTK